MSLPAHNVRQAIPTLSRELAEPVVIAETPPVTFTCDVDDAFFIGRQLIAWRRTNFPNPETAEQIGRVGKALMAAGKAKQTEVTLAMADAIGVGLSLKGIARGYRRTDMAERLARLGAQMYAAGRAKVAEVAP